MKIKTTALILLSGTTVSLGLAQESVHAAGGNVSSAGGNVSYSIGQVVYQNYNTPNGSVEQGVQHAYEIVTAGIGSSNLHVGLSVYPNPTLGVLHLTVEKLVSNMEYQLFSETGQLIRSEQLKELTISIDASSLASGIYFLNVLTNKEQVESFKIIKN